MSLLDDLTVALFMVWCLSEVAISLINVVNRLRRRAGVEDRFSFLGIWLALIVTVALAMLTWLARPRMAAFGDAGAPQSLAGWLGCACLVGGITIRLAAVAALGGQFTTQVIIVAQQQIVDRGPYHYVRHPAYLGLLLALLGFGLCAGNGISLVVAIGLPLTAVMYWSRRAARDDVGLLGPAPRNLPRSVARRLYHAGQHQASHRSTSTGCFRPGSGRHHGTAVACRAPTACRRVELGPPRSQVPFGSHPASAGMHPHILLEVL